MFEIFARILQVWIPELNPVFVETIPLSLDPSIIPTTLVPSLLCFVFVVTCGGYICTVDSGAVDHVANRKTAAHVPIKPTEMSSRGAYYEAANGSPIWNEGEKDVKGESEAGTNLELTFQVAGVKGPIGSVRKVCKAGNLVIFDEDEGVIVNKKTGIKTPFTVNEKGISAFRMWVRKNQGFQMQEK